MQLHDRLRLLVVLDSVGEYQGWHRLFHSLGLPPLHSTLSLWASNKDRCDNYHQEYFKKMEVRRKRSALAITKMKEGSRKAKRAKKMGVTYESGIALQEDNASGIVAPSGDK